MNPSPSLEWLNDVKDITTPGMEDKVLGILQAALGQGLPQMEIRFQDLAITADFVVNATETHSIPTVWTSFKNLLFSRFSRTKHVVHKEILKPISGAFRPGTITLVLGQPSSGKSSLMKVLSGRFPVSRNVKIQGAITYNGRKREDMLHVLPQVISYMGQRDVHYPTLTVEETLLFAHECSGGKTMPNNVTKMLYKGTVEDNEIAAKLVTNFFDNYPTNVMKALGLSHCAKTVVGDEILRGVSGGERKRVTTGEMKFGMKLVDLMDEISTGLDSAATLDIVKASQRLAHTFRKTAVISLLQPSPQVFERFDDILVLNDGYIMYHGPRTKVLEYFESLGFSCPERRDVADYLLDLGTDQQDLYVVSDTKQVPRQASEFAARYKASAIHKEMLTRIAGPIDGSHFDLQFPQYHQSFLASTRTVMKRQLKLMMRNTAFIKGRMIMVVVMGLLYGLTFYQMDVSLAQLVLGMIFSSIMFIAIGQASQVNTFFSSRAIFYKQRGAHFYRTTSYVLSTSLAQIPFAIVESIAFGTLVYWMTGFVADASAYIVFILALFVANLTFAAWFFFISSASPNLLMAQPLTFISILIYVIFAGFLLSKDAMPSYCVWILWINPLAWCFRLLSVNQYTSSAMQVCEFQGVDYCHLSGMKMGTYQLALYGFEADSIWIAYGFIYMVGAYVAFMLLSCFFLEYKRYESPEGMSVSVEEHDAVAADIHVSSNIKVAPMPADSTAINVPHAQATPVTLAFQDVWYSVPDKSGHDKHLLQGVSGYAQPGTCTALMGSSGAGKTTLMDVLAGRKTGGTIQGRITLNGHPATKLAISRATGYCEQTDQHCESATFREALEFSAFLRQSSDISNEQKLASVDECLTLLVMHSLANTIVRGASVEQMKRLTIGVELASNASILFLDEPTSGLDARAALRIMRGLSQVAKSGRTVVCTIHQPSSEVFSMFDNLLLLRRGGNTVYFGPLGENSSTLVKYLEAIPGTSPIQPGHNPATWMLEVIGAGTAASTEQPQDFAKIFEESQAKINMLEVLHQENNTNRKEMLFTRKCAADPQVQMKLVIQRFIRLYWRTPSYNLMRILINFALAIVFGIIYCSSTYSTFSGLNGGVGVVFLSTLFIGIMGFNSVIPLFVQERASFYRERACETYSAVWYFVGSTIVEIPYAFVSVISFTIIFYPFVGFLNATQAVLYTIYLFLFVLLQVYLGQFLAVALPSIEVASTVGGLLNSIFFLFMGFNPPTSQIPTGLQWLNTIVPPKYALSLLVSAVFCKCDNPGDNDLGCEIMSNVPLSVLVYKFNKAKSVTIKQYIETMFQMNYSDSGHHAGVLIICIIIFRLFCFLAMRYVNHQNR
ncbi:ATP-binding Cassette (ABC) Superfamily [Thraustotheca clavata]|uniref:ATP-binding Cassette (ABC) Superfamily n=1 Tax=Thraustotheca clavata TaxID=74557 RepID=A0A1V9YVU9_9STRA|nr:ATP-binding Cassette (ABC) Superfamily [Thraustotheca clavata]